MSDEKNDVPPERIWIEFAEPWGIRSWASDHDWAVSEINRGRKFRAFIDQSIFEAVQRERDELSDQFDKAVSPEYLASALAAVNAVDGEWKSRAEAAEAEIEKLREALRPFAEYKVISVCLVENRYIINLAGKESRQPRLSDFYDARAALFETDHDK